MNYAIVLISGKQTSVSLGQIITVGKVDGEKGQKVTFDKILLYKDGESVQIGQPYLPDFTVEGEILEQFKGEKMYVKKYKQKVRYRRKIGFRAMLTKIKITKIGKEAKKKKAAK